MRKMLFLLVTSAWALLASESFSHKDWRVACDNTHTCRMAGYTEHTVDWEDVPLSILIERDAGPKSRISGFIHVDNSMGNLDMYNLTDRTLKMYIGTWVYVIDPSGKLSQAQTDSLIDALVKDQEIRLTYGDSYEWSVSQQGSFAAMLKMDDYQKRIGTIGAMFKKGKQNEDDVLKAEPVPVIDVPRFYPNVQADATLLELPMTDGELQLLQHLLSRFYSKHGGNKCWMDAEEAKETLKVYRLTETAALASQRCRTEMHDDTKAFWLINATPPFEPKFVHSATGLYVYHDGSLRMSGARSTIGPIGGWESEHRVWNGKEFVESSNCASSQCRDFPDGVWDLPTFISAVNVQE